MKYPILFLLNSMVFFSGFSQIPENDECTNALQISSLTQQNILNVNMVNATSSSLAWDSTHSCEGLQFTSSFRDVWYRFNGAPGKRYQLKVSGNGNLHFQVLSNDCGNFELVQCETSFSGSFNYNGSLFPISRNIYIPTSGSYFLRVARPTTLNNQNFQFSLIESPGGRKLHSKSTGGPFTASSTWLENRVPENGDSIFIENGAVVSMSGPVPELGYLAVGSNGSIGKLISNLSSTQSMVVRGEFLVGTHGTFSLGSALNLSIYKDLINNGIFNNQGKKAWILAVLGSGKQEIKGTGIFLSDTLSNLIVDKMDSLIVQPAFKCSIYEPKSGVIRFINPFTIIDVQIFNRFEGGYINHHYGKTIGTILIAHKPGAQYSHDYTLVYQRPDPTFHNVESQINDGNEWIPGMKVNMDVRNTNGILNRQPIRLNGNRRDWKPESLNPGFIIGNPADTLFAGYLRTSYTALQNLLASPPSTWGQEGNSFFYGGTFTFENQPLADGVSGSGNFGYGRVPLSTALPYLKSRVVIPFGPLNQLGPAQKLHFSILQQPPSGSLISPLTGFINQEVIRISSNQVLADSIGFGFTYNNADYWTRTGPTPGLYHPQDLCLAQGKTPNGPWKLISQTPAGPNPELWPKIRLTNLGLNLDSGQYFCWATKGNPVNGKIVELLPPPGFRVGCGTSSSNLPLGVVIQNLGNQPIQSAIVRATLTETNQERLEPFVLQTALAPMERDTLWFDMPVGFDFAAHQNYSAQARLFVGNDSDTTDNFKSQTFNLLARGMPYSYHFETDLTGSGNQIFPRNWFRNQQPGNGNVPIGWTLTQNLNRKLFFRNAAFLEQPYYAISDAIGPLSNGHFLLEFSCQVSSPGAGSGQLFFPGDTLSAWYSKDCGQNFTRFFAAYSDGFTHAENWFRVSETIESFSGEHIAIKFMADIRSINANDLYISIDSLNLSPIQSVSDQKEALSFHTFPNPFQNTFIVYAKSNLDAQGSGPRIWDGQGKEVFPLLKKLKDDEWEVQTQNLPPGIYLIQWNGHTKRMVKP